VKLLLDSGERHYSSLNIALDFAREYEHPAIIEMILSSNVLSNITLYFVLDEILRHNQHLLLKALLNSDKLSIEQWSAVIALAKSKNNSKVQQTLFDSYKSSGESLRLAFEQAMQPIP
jgi:hypothetical protein